MSRHAPQREIFTPLHRFHCGTRNAITGNANTLFLLLRCTGITTAKRTGGQLAMIGMKANNLTRQPDNHFEFI